MRDVHSDLAKLVPSLLPGAELVSVQPLKPDSEGGTATSKSVGYGAPLRIRIRTAEGVVKSLVLHTATANAFGHDRRSDRARDMLLAYDTFGSIPKQVPALDVGAISADSTRLLSLRGTSEFYLLTEWAEGHVYADELRDMAERGTLTPLDLAHCRTLAHYLAELHSTPVDEPIAYTRAVRDLVGNGEGIFGIIDGYPADVPAAPASRLQDIERRCVEFRWRLKEQRGRLRRTHGDFHPFNILFDERSELTLLDTSRGSLGDPADDVACLAINYPFFALGEREVWTSAFRQLWYEFWSTYGKSRSDDQLYSVVAPFFAWRGLVLANPVWYGSLRPRSRDQLLRFVEAVLSADRFSPEMVELAFT